MTILDPKGRITDEEVLAVLTMMGADDILMVVEFTAERGETLIRIDHDIPGIGYYEQDMNQLLGMVANYFIIQGCDFSTDPHVRASQEDKIREA